MPVKEVLKETEAKMEKAIVSIRREFAEVRTGRAHPGLIEGLHANYYDTPTMLKEMASITVPDSKTIAIQPWDPTAIPVIEKAINDSHLGIAPQNDGKTIRLNIPPLSEERRQDLVKVTKEMAEQGRVSIRTIRRDANDKIKKMKADKQISEDDERKAHDDVQKVTDQYVKQVDALLAEKDKILLEN